MIILSDLLIHIFHIEPSGLKILRLARGRMLNHCLLREALPVAQHLHNMICVIHTLPQKCKKRMSRSSMQKSLLALRGLFLLDLNHLLLLKPSPSMKQSVSAQPQLAKWTLSALPLKQILDKLLASFQLMIPWT